MSHCHQKTCRCVTVLACTLAVAGLSAAYLFGCPESPLAKAAIDTSAFATKEEVLALRDEGLSLFGDLKSDVVRTVGIEIDGAKKESHARRKALADELRKEADAKVGSVVAAESVIRGQQITAERAQRRRETGELFESRDKVYASLLAHRDEIVALRKQLFAVEQAWLKHRCPEPCKCARTPPAPAKVVPAPNMYTIPYRQFYERPKACPQ